MRSNRVFIGAVYKDWIQLDGVSEVSTDVSIYHHAVTVAHQCITYVFVHKYPYVYKLYFGHTSVMYCSCHDHQLAFCFLPFCLHAETPYLS